MTLSFTRDTTHYHRRAKFITSATSHDSFLSQVSSLVPSREPSLTSSRAPSCFLVPLELARHFPSNTLPGSSSFTTKNGIHKYPLFLSLGTTRSKEWASWEWRRRLWSQQWLMQDISLYQLTSFHTITTLPSSLEKVILCKNRFLVNKWHQYLDSQRNFSLPNRLDFGIGPEFIKSRYVDQRKISWWRIVSSKSCLLIREVNIHQPPHEI